MSICHNNHGKSSAVKMNEHTVAGYSLLTHCSFDLIKNKFDCCTYKNCIKRFCKEL